MCDRMKERSLLLFHRPFSSSPTARMCWLCLRSHPPIELFFPTKREQEEFKWPEKNATNPPSLPSQATTLLPSRATTVYMITSTKPRNTQKLDLTSLCQTLMHVSNLVWIVVESSSVKSRGVTKVLERCQVPSVHLNVPEHSSVLEQRNAGLKFLVETFCDVERCDGVVCFGNDGTKYDIRLFNEVTMCCVLFVRNHMPIVS